MKKISKKSSSDHFWEVILIGCLFLFIIILLGISVTGFILFRYFTSSSQSSKFDNDTKIEIQVPTSLNKKDYNSDFNTDFEDIINQFNQNNLYFDDSNKSDLPSLSTYSYLKKTI